MADVKATSTQAVISALLANLALFGAFVAGFLLLRVKFKRIYSPRSSFQIVDEEYRPPELSPDPISWIFKVSGRNHTQLIQYAGLDGYFFLRYVFIMALLFFCGILSYVVLLPINAVNGKGNQGFDKLSISNVSDSHRYYAHVFVGWIFYGFVIFIIFREMFYYNSLRCAMLSSPKYAKKLSSRTVLFQSVPNVLLDEKQFFKMFNGVKRVYIVRNFRKLDAKIRERDALVNKLEASENALLKKAYKYKMKMDKKGQTIEDPENIDSYVPENKRPRFRPNGMFKPKVDTIRYCLEKIPQVDKEVRALQKQHRHAHPKNSIFVEFENQYMAQLAYQATVHHNPLRMVPTATGVEPGEINWANLRMYWWEHAVRKFIAVAAVVAIIILWAIPVAFVGVISNVTYLTNKLTFLKFIYNLPDVLLGLITSLLPTVLLMLLNTFLPIFIRALAQVFGCTTVQGVELFTHVAYFGFLIVNNFIVVTIASSATSVVTQIVQEPTSAMSLLANNLPKSSNFFISYIVLQGFVNSGSTLFQIVALFIFYIMNNLLDKTVRKKYARWNNLDGMTWGTLFPVYVSLACITLAYAIISPMILIFAFLAFALVFIAFNYNLTYIMMPGPEVRGLHYPKALFQTFVGVYLGQVCLLGIMVVGKGWGPIVLQAISIGFTAYCHYTLSRAFDRLLSVVPVDIMKPLDGVSETPSFNGQTDYKVKVLDKVRSKHQRKHLDEDLVEAVEEDQDINKQVKQDLLHEDYEVEREQSVYSINPVLADRDFKRLESKNIVVKFLRPDVFGNFRHAKRVLPASYSLEPQEEDNKHAYDLPSISKPLGNVWIPADPMGLSKREIENARKVIEMTDENAGFDKKGNIVFTGPQP